MQDMTDEVKQAYALGDQLRDLREQADFRPPPRPPYWLHVLPAPEGQVLTYSTAIKWLSEDHGVLLDLLYRTRETEQTFTKGSFDYLSADIDTMTRACADVLGHPGQSHSKHVKVSNIGNGQEREAAGNPENPHWSEIRRGLSTALLDVMQDERRSRVEHRVHRELASLVTIIKYELEDE